MSRAILWFRLNLRLHDNEALIQAVKSNPKALFPVFTIDPHYAVKVRVGIRRWQFLLETLEDLDKSLRSIGSRLIVCRGNPMELFPQLVTEWSITHLFMMSENQGGWSVERDASLCDMMEKLGVKTLITEGHNLYSLTKIVELNKGKPPLTYTSFLSVIKKLPQPAASAPAPTELPPVDQPCLNGSLKDVMLDTTVGDHVNHRDPINVEQREVMFKRMAGPNGNFDVPKIIEFGFQTLPIEDQSPHRGGETEALKRLTAYMAQKDKVAKFEKPKTSPAAFNPADTTVLSPYLKFGALSCRLFYHNIMEIYLQKLKHSQPPVSLLGQLLWRDFYYVIAYHTPNYHKMQGNSVCLQIDWWCREGSVDPENETATKNLVAWSEARTGYPWIDAIMTQLRKEGWIHHLARHSTACFLTRGDLFISWERGAEVFEELLLDHDPALNIGNWLWLSASAYFHQYYRVYSPVAFGKKYDKTGKYIRKYVPVLKKLPTEYIFEPWLAPPSVLKQAGIVLGENYPHPIVDHNVVSKTNMRRLKIAYAEGIKGGPGLPSTVHELENEAVMEVEEDVESEDEEGDGKGKRKAKAKENATKKAKTKK